MQTFILSYQRKLKEKRNGSYFIDNSGKTRPQARLRYTSQMYVTNVLTTPRGIRQVVVDFPVQGFVKWPNDEAQKLQKVEEERTDKEHIGKQQEPDRPALPVLHGVQPL